MKETVVITGSSRSTGNTAKIAKTISNQYNTDIINLNNYTFSYYDYESKK